VGSPDFLKLWTGQTISGLGSRITREGIPLTALLVLHAGAAPMGLLSALGGAAILVFGLVMGIRRCEAPPARQPPEHLLAEALAGLRRICADPVLRAIGLRSATAWAFHGFLGSLYMLYAIDILRLSPARPASTRSSTPSAAGGHDSRRILRPME
jgi:hypothetical protein